MTVFLNGQLLPEAEAKVSVFDRGFLYGDGLFETLRVWNAKPFRWESHWDRLTGGAEFLGMKIPFGSEAMREQADALIATNRMPHALLRITISRGSGVRGYSPKGADHPSTVMSMHPAPEFVPAAPPRWRLVTSSLRLPAGEPLAQFKTCNKLPQILARSQADALGVEEALLLNSDGYVGEAASSNLFWISDSVVCTAPLASGILPGVTRAVVFELCRSLGLEAAEDNIRSPELRHTEGVFLSLSSTGIAECTALDGERVPVSPLTSTISDAFWKLVRKECE